MAGISPSRDDAHRGDRARPRRRGARRSRGARQPRPSAPRARPDNACPAGHRMRENGLDEPNLLRLMAEEAALDALSQQPGRIAGTVADELRLTGRFSELAARGSAKRRWAEEAGVAGRRPSELELSDLLDWFATERLGSPLDRVPPAAELAARLGFSDIDEFTAALWLERAYTCRLDGASPPDAAIGVRR